MPESDIVGKRKIICQKNVLPKEFWCMYRGKLSGIFKEISIFLKVQ